MLLWPLSPVPVRGCVLHHRVQNHRTTRWDFVCMAVCWHPGRSKASEGRLWIETLLWRSMDCTDTYYTCVIMWLTWTHLIGTALRFELEQTDLYRLVQEPQREADFLEEQWGCSKLTVQEPLSCSSQCSYVWVLALEQCMGGVLRQETHVSLVAVCVHI